QEAVANFLLGAETLSTRGTASRRRSGPLSRPAWSVLLDVHRRRIHSFTTLHLSRCTSWETRGRGVREDAPIAVDWFGSWTGEHRWDRRCMTWRESPASP